jgi:putative transposase
MPNHFHGIIGFNDIPISKSTGKPSDLTKIISSFKSSAYRKVKALCLDYGEGVDQGDFGKQGLFGTKGLIYNYNTIWQKSFYDHIIRNEQDLQRIREYVANNPLSWELDSLNLKTQKQVSIPH